MRLFTARRLVALGALGCATVVTALPAQAYEAKISPQLTCALGKEGAEVEAQHMLLPAPPNGATVLEGTPVTFSGESSHALMFSVASSPALLSSPDIDGGQGSSHLGSSLYTFTSTEATATLRTIYWAASFTFTPEDCESPFTFMTPAHTLTVVSPSPTAEEAAIKQKQEEEAAAKKKREEEAAATGSVSLDEVTIDVQSAHEAAVKLACTGTGMCSGKLSLMGEVPLKKGKKTKVETEVIGTATFSISAAKTTTVKLTLNTTGRRLLSTDHGRLDASLTILESSPSPSQVHTESVRLVSEGHQGRKSEK